MGVGVKWIVPLMEERESVDPKAMARADTVWEYYVVLALASHAIGVQASLGLLGGA